MTITIEKSATQTLFDRVIRTWVFPEVESRTTAKQREVPFVLGMALIIWDQKSGPRVLLNDEAGTIATQMEIVNSGPVTKGQSIELVTSAD
jgi:hypothetical protein